MKQVIIFKGLPASGKSTAAKKLIDGNPGAYKRVSKDDLRAMLDNSRWSPDNEKMILAVRDNIILEALDRGKHVIVDDTNLHEKHVIRIRELVKGKAEVVVEFFDVGVNECIARDLKRPISVGEKVIRNMYNQFLKPKEEKYVPDITKPTAYIFDVDGTLAEMSGRSPYDWNRVNEDLPRQNTVSLLHDLSKSHKIIIFTGRDGACEKETKQWLLRHGIGYEHFDIRPKGNTEKDAIIKKRMFDKVKDEYNILGVFDDRDQVVEMWREIGLQCFQVNYGDF